MAPGLSGSVAGDSGLQGLAATHAPTCPLAHCPPRSLWPPVAASCFVTKGNRNFHSPGPWDEDTRVPCGTRGLTRYFPPD